VRYRTLRKFGRINPSQTFSNLFPRSMTLELASERISFPKLSNYIPSWNTHNTFTEYIQIHVHRECGSTPQTSTWTFHCKFLSSLGSKFKSKIKIKRDSGIALPLLNFQRGFGCPLVPNVSVPKIFGLTNAIESSDTLSFKFGETFRPSIRSIIQGVPEILTISWL